jgi:hypothetical protein
LRLPASVVDLVRQLTYGVSGSTGVTGDVATAGVVAGFVDASSGLVARYPGILAWLSRILAIPQPPPFLLPPSSLDESASELEVKIREGTKRLVTHMHPIIMIYPPRSHPIYHSQ